MHAFLRASAARHCSFQTGEHRDPRRMNSATSSVIVLYRPAPSIR
jgi:hypothetical protein